MNRIVVQMRDGVQGPYCERVTGPGGAACHIRLEARADRAAAYDMLPDGTLIATCGDTFEDVYPHVTVRGEICHVRR